MSNNSPYLDPHDFVIYSRKRRRLHDKDGPAALQALPRAPKHVTHPALRAIRPPPLPPPRPRSPSHYSQPSSTTDSRYPNPTPPPENASIGLNPHPVHWYEDGNLLIEFGGVHFKLFWTLMAKSSTFFQERYDSWKSNNEKKDLMTGKEPIRLDEEVVLVVGDFVELLDLIYPSNPYRLVDQRTLKSTLSILSASHVLAFEQLLPLWSMGEDFGNLVVIINHSVEEARRTFNLARTCKIYDVLKPAVYSLLRLPSFGLGDQDQRIYEYGTDVDFVRGRERLSSHWTATLSCLRLPSCVHKSRQDFASISSQSSTPLCASDDPVKSDLIQFRVLYKNGFYHEFMNDPLTGLNILRSQLIPPTTSANPNLQRKKRKRGKGTARHYHG
ncbi:hypothetical protein BDN72DRAFT_956152 [Pluteus cervinus]|uniref:Uncharacterized protein n=1 Tax=Pluteus cervinus TaxID=181527 RepID=A0ACD3B6U6_9AGAR|nr:hypothetical protein BDN72DRAFT_956152 [Pluteus cervinus]